MDPNEYQRIKKNECYGKDLIESGSGHHYSGADPNSCYNEFIEIVEYHIDKLPIFQYILDASGPKGNYGGWLRVQTNKGKHPVIYTEKYEAIFKQYIFSEEGVEIQRRSTFHYKGEMIQHNDICIKIKIVWIQLP